MIVVPSFSGSRSPIRRGEYAWTILDLKMKTSKLVDHIGNVVPVYTA
jgi:hypothetical protein